MSLKNTKSSDLAPRGGWAPGDYICRCRFCTDMFWGDKRAVSCADCAYLRPDKAPSVEVEVEAAKILVMLDEVRAGDPGAQEALDNLRAYLRKQVGFDDHNC